ncbi:hypothetical protein QCC73_004657 [Enterobacter hormaechei]|nr:hypothetical protein [Enterobacter hormaechei]
MIEEIRNIAAQWRQDNQENPGGVVLILQGAVYGWKNELRDPQQETPGAYAVDEFGSVFRAEGGNDYDGAERWAAVQIDDASPIWPGLLQPAQDLKPYDLAQLATFPIVPIGTSGPRSDAEYLRIAQLADGLNGKDFAMLTEDELQRFRCLQREGRKFGLTAWVEVLNDDEIIQAELAAASPAQREEIYRRLRTEVGVRWFALDYQPRTEK